MSWLEEAWRSLHASWLLAMHDPDAYAHFKNTEAGFWRSFSAIFIVAPLYLYAATAQARFAGGEGAASPSLVWAAIGLVVQWIAWPLIMVLIARQAGLSRNYGRYIIAYNWSGVLIIAALMPPLLLMNLGLAQGAAAILSFAVLIASLYYRWYIAVTALETTGLVAAALVASDVALSLGVNRLIG
jgi:hypothetical protein